MIPEPPNITGRNILQRRKKKSSGRSRLARGHPAGPEFLDLLCQVAIPRRGISHSDCSFPGPTSRRCSGPSRNVVRDPGSGLALAECAERVPHPSCAGFDISGLPSRSHLSATHPCSLVFLACPLTSDPRESSDGQGKGEGPWGVRRPDSWTFLSFCADL